MNRGKVILFDSCQRMARLPWLRGAFYVFYTLVCAVVIIWVFYRVRRPAMPPVIPSPYLYHESYSIPRDLFFALGAISGDRHSRYWNFPRKKKAGVMRIGAFGDSFTWGAEVGEGSDFPSQLGEMLSSAEVLNFGNAWHGFHQAARFWEWAAPEYEIDYVLLGPSTILDSRSLTFNHDYFAPFLYYLHGRYILEGDDARFVQIHGTSEMDRLERYRAFWPGMELLRFDRNPSGFLWAAMNPGSSWAQPFYYSGLEPEEEKRLLARILLKRMCAQSKKVIMIESSESQLNGTCPNLVIRPMPALRQFPYAQFSRHWNALGNQAIAEIFFSLLRDTGSGFWHHLEFDDTWTGEVSTQTGKDLGGEARLWLGNAKGGALYQARRSLKLEAPPGQVPSGTKSFLIFSSREGHTLEGLWLPLPFVPAQGATITRGCKGKEVELGKISKTFRGPLRAVYSPDFSVTDLPISAGQERFMRRLLQLPGSLCANEELKVDGKTVAHSVHGEGKNAVYEPEGADFFVPMMDPDFRLDFRAMPAEEGGLELRFARGPAVVVARWRVHKEAGP